MLKKIIKKYKRIITYTIVGILTTLVSLISYFLLTNTFLNPNNAFQIQIANIVAWILSVSFAYIMNRIMVFKSKNKKIKIEILKFYSLRLFTLFLDMFFMLLFVSVLKYNDFISKAIVQFLILTGNYIISKFFVFKNE